MRQVLFHAKNNAELAEKGYTIVDFLSQNQAKVLSDYYSANPNTYPNTFHATHFNTDVSYKQRVQQFILETLVENFARHFAFHQPVFANFMVKEGGGNNPMPLHADWAYVDENNSSSYAVWIPLVNTNMENGCIGVIPFSQHLSYHIRGPRILQWTPPTEEMLIGKLGKLFSMKTGQALIYNHRTLHYSLPNNTATVRPSVNISLTPKGESLIHYTMPEGEKTVLKFEVADDKFFIDYDNFQMPRHGKIIERISPETIPLLNESAENFIGQYEVKGLRAYLKKIFS